MAINACVADWPRAMELLDEMRKDVGVKDDFSAMPYSSTLRALKKGGEWEKACGLLRQLSARGIAHNKFMTNVVLTACLDAAEAASGPAATPPAAAGIRALQDVLDVTRFKTVASGPPPPPPVDGRSVARALFMTPRVEVGSRYQQSFNG